MMQYVFSDAERTESGIEAFVNAYESHCMSFRSRRSLSISFETLIIRLVYFVAILASIDLALIVFIALMVK